MANEENFWRILVNQCRQEQRQNGSAQEGAAIVRLADFLLQETAACNASDLHIEPLGGEVRFRLRIDGLLTVMPYRLPGDLASPLISRIKVLANMDIAKHQQPQDGAFVFSAGERKIDVRAAAMPVYGGEMLVLRLMNLQEELLTLDELGFLPDVKQKFRELIHRPAGLVIVSGAMGCGKSSTLYAALQELNTADKNWLTLDVYATI